MKYSIICLKLSIIFFLNIQLSSQTPDYEMLVSSRNTNSVKRFNAQTGAYIDDFISPGSGGLNTTQDILLLPGGNILASGRGNTRILMYDKTSGDYIGPFTSGYTLNNPTKITFGPDSNLYVSQWGASNQKIVRFNGTSGQFINEFTQSLNLPLGHAWDSLGNLYAACYGSGDVRKFDTAGNYAGIFTQPGHLQGPTNLWFDKNGNLFVIDWILGSVIQFSAASGAFIKVFITGLQNAEGYAFGPDSNLYICDWSQNDIKKYTPGGSFINIFTSQGNMQAPNSILFREGSPIGIQDESYNIRDFTLHQNYPNPFNPSTKIKFDIQSSGFASLNIFDIAGRKIETIVKKELKAGIYEFNWNASVYHSGVYFYRLSVSGFTETKKMIFLK